MTKLLLSLDRCLHPRNYVTWVFSLGLILASALYLASSCSFGFRAQTVSAANSISASQEVEDGAKATKYASDFRWENSLSEDLSLPGLKLVHLSRCAPGVRGTNRYYWVYLSGAGSSEVVLVTGGTCAGDGKSGTLTFTTVHAHPGQSTMASATSGIQEASIAAAVSNIGGKNHDYQQGGYVRVGPGQFQLYSPLTLLVSYQTVDFSGSTVVCNFDVDCINVGDQKSYNATSNITLINPRGEPTIAHGQHAFIVAWGQKTRIFNLGMLIGKLVSGETFGTFGSYVNVAGDQAFLLDGLHTSSGLECTASFCGTVIKAPGPFSGTGGYGSGGDNAALGWIKNANLDLQCTGNGIDWQSGNNLRITDSVIQGYPQFGVRGGLAKGGYGMLSMENVFMEVGACTNPLGNIGIAGVIVQGGKVKIAGGEGPDWHKPSFANVGPIGYQYYVVPYSTRWGYGNPLYIGNASTNGKGHIPLSWPDIPTSTAFDILKLPTARDANGDSFIGPYGTGKYAIATRLTRAIANCSGGVCSFSDAQTAPMSYNVHPVTYFPFLSYWPGQLVLGPSGEGNSVTSNSSASLDLNDLNAINLWQVNTAGPIQTLQTVSEGKCMPLEGSPVSVSCLGSSYSFAPMATILTNKVAQDGGHLLDLKGRLNFLTSGSGPNHIITLVDSDPNKTAATVGLRPPNDSTDAFIGCDTTYCQGSTTGLTFGAPVSLSNYIGNTGDGKRWKERLTEKEKTFAVPVVIENGRTLTLGSGTAISQIKMFTTSGISDSQVSAQSCVDVSGVVEGLAASDQISGVKPPKPLGNLSLNAYASAANTITLHFCNPSTSSVNAPQGLYSFVAVH
jgi:hypothetical protein